MNPQKRLLKAEGLHRGFRNRSAVLNGVSLEVRVGEAIGVVGSNGSGKTTLLRVLGGLLEPDSGSVERSFGRVGWSPAGDGGFFPQLTGRQNLDFFAAYQGVPRARLLEAAAKWSAAAPLSEALKTPVGRCSSGMRQLLSLCRAELHSPELWILDEPTRGLDPESADFVRERLREYRAGGGALVFSSHTAEDSWTILARVYCLDGGKLVPFD